MKIEELSYEEAEKKLEELISKLETENMELKDSIDSFKVATELYKHCNKLLSKAEGDINIILDGIEEEFDMED